jgi:hypothetical protein
MRAALLNRPRRSALTLIGLASASISGLAILLHAAGWLPMYFIIDLLGPPSLALLALLGIYARRVDERLFLNRLIVGAWAGLAATGAYDLVRLGLRASGVIGFDPFRTHPIFGMLITGQPLGSSTALAAGWAYHLWNGVGFAMMYTLVAGPAHPAYALGWAMLLEVAWLTALPSALSFQLNPDLLLVSLVGHTAYGLALGLVARRFVQA